MSALPLLCNKTYIQLVRRIYNRDYQGYILAISETTPCFRQDVIISLLYQVTTIIGPGNCLRRKYESLCNTLLGDNTTEVSN